MLDHQRRFLIHPLVYKLDKYLQHFLSQIDITVSSFKSLLIGKKHNIIIIIVGIFKSLRSTIVFNTRI